MERRNFIKNTGLTIAGLALSKGIYSKNISNLKSLNIIVLLSGGVRYIDIIDETNHQHAILFQEKASMKVVCKSRVNYSGNTLEHDPCVIDFLFGLPNDSSKKILISNKNSTVTKAVADANLPLEIITTSSLNIDHPYRNDAAIFESATTFLNPCENLTLILNLEDTDIAHCNSEKYFDVLNYYNQQINHLCNKLYAKQSVEKYDAKLIVAAVLGRNNFDNELTSEHNKNGCDHYDESARKLFCFETSYAEVFEINFDNQIYNSKELLKLNKNISI